MLVLSKKLQYFLIQPQINHENQPAISNKRELQNWYDTMTCQRFLGFIYKTSAFCRKHWTMDSRARQTLIGPKGHNNYVNKLTRSLVSSDSPVHIRFWTCCCVLYKTTHAKTTQKRAWEYLCMLIGHLGPWTLISAFTFSHTSSSSFNLNAHFTSGN